MHPNIIAVLSIMAKVWKKPRCPLIDEWIKKMRYIYIHTMDCYSAIKKNKILPFTTTWMKPEGIMLNEICHSKKDKYMTSLIGGL